MKKIWRFYAPKCCCIMYLLVYNEVAESSNHTHQKQNPVVCSELAWRKRHGVGILDSSVEGLTQRRHFTSGSYFVSNGAFSGTRQEYKAR